MTVKFATAAAVAALMAAPALAQSDKSGQQQQQGAAAAQQSGQGTQYDGAEGRNPDIKTMNRDAEDYMTGQAGQGSGGMTEQDRQIMAASQEEVRQTLAESGFENVRIRRAAYLVTAMTPDGEPVMMMVDTDRMGGGRMGQQGQQQMNRSGDGQQSGGMTQQDQQSQ